MNLLILTLTLFLNIGMVLQSNTKTINSIEVHSIPIFQEFDNPILSIKDLLALDCGDKYRFKYNRNSIFIDYQLIINEVSYKKEPEMEFSPTITCIVSFYQEVPNDTVSFDYLKNCKINDKFVTNGNFLFERFSKLIPYYHYVQYK